MAFFTISGIPGCVQFAHALYVAQILEDHLPYFKYKKIEKTSTEWPTFVENINLENQWHQSSSPIIWKEISMWGGRKYLIGEVHQFWEYCYCYYGLESIIPQSELKKLAADNLKYFQNNKAKTRKVTTVSIMGALNHETTLFINDLLSVKELEDVDGIAIKLFDKKLYTAKSVRAQEKLDDIASYYNSLNYYGKSDLVKVVEEELDAMDKCDLLVITDNYSQEKNEDKLDWLQRCFLEMSDLSEQINRCAKHDLRIIICGYGPVCFLATCLIEFCTVLKASNIIVVTSDLGLSTINSISEVTGVPVAKISAPPVWGFIGINSFIDAVNTLFDASVFRPFNRALNAPSESTLPLGTVTKEIRTLSYLIKDKQEEIVFNIKKKRERMEFILERKPVFAKLRALINVIKLWYSEDDTGSIISLGVCSNGSFGIPPGIVFSQPCMRNELHRWKPFKLFGLMNENSSECIKCCVSETLELLDSVGFSRRDCTNVSQWTSSNSNLDIPK